MCQTAYQNIDKMLSGLCHAKWCSVVTPKCSRSRMKRCHSHLQPFKQHKRNTAKGKRSMDGHKWTRLKLTDGIFYEFSKWRKREIRKPITELVSLPKGNGSSVNRDVKPGLWVSQVVTSIRGEAMPEKWEWDRYNLPVSDFFCTT